MSRLLPLRRHLHQLRYPLFSGFGSAGKHNPVQDVFAIGIGEAKVEVLGAGCGGKGDFEIKRDDFDMFAVYPTKTQGFINGSTPTYGGLVRIFSVVNQPNGLLHVVVVLEPISPGSAGFGIE